jgi:hypothetical protein
VALTTPSIAKEVFVAQLSHLGSEILAECITRPQYVLRSNWEDGRSRLPGSEDVMLAKVKSNYCDETIESSTNLWALYVH